MYRGRLLRIFQFSLEANSYVFVVVAIAIPKTFFAPMTTTIVRVVVAVPVEMTSVSTTTVFTKLAVFVTTANLDDFCFTRLKY